MSFGNLTYPRYDKREKVKPPIMPLKPEQQAIVDAVIERAEQACRYALKHNETAWSGDGCPDENYRAGFEIACGICEGAIRDAVMRHIEADLAEQHAKDGEG